MISKIIATGSYLPHHKITNDDLAQFMDTSDAWIHQRTGIRSRYFEDDSNTNMATQAALNTGFDLEQVDAIIVCTYTPDDLIPTVASSVKKALGLQRPIPCFDINAACTGFLYGLEVADSLVKTGKYRHILLIGSDFNSRVMDFTDRASAVLFGDGAGAIILTQDPHSGIIDTQIHAVDDQDESILLHGGNDFPNPYVKRDLEEDIHFRMKGADVFRFAVSVFSKSIENMMQKHNLSGEDIDFVISHQANKRIIESGARALKMPLSKFPMNLDRVGNTSAGSIPILLDEMFKDGRLQKGMRILLIAFGGGLSHGVSYLEV